MKTSLERRTSVARSLAVFAVACVVAVLCCQSDCGCGQPPQPVQKQCPLENVVRKVPISWYYCPYDSIKVKLVNPTLMSIGSLKIGPIQPKWCPVQEVNLQEAQTTWTHCPYDGAALEPAHPITD